MEQSTRPPRGIIPRFLWEEQRLTDIQGAIERHMMADHPIPDEWLFEFRELFERKLERLKTTDYNHIKWDEVEKIENDIREGRYWETTKKPGDTEVVSRNAGGLQPLKDMFRRNPNKNQ